MCRLRDLQVRYSKQHAIVVDSLNKGTPDERSLQRTVLLDTVIQFAKCGSYLKDDELRAIVNEYFNSGFNYAAVSKKYGRSINSINVSLSRVRKLFFRIIDQKLINEIEFGDLTKAQFELQIQVQNRTVLTDIPQEYRKHLPFSTMGVTEKLPLNQCGAEIELLSYILPSNFKKKIEMCDANKLQYLISILDNPADSFREKAELFQLLEATVMAEKKEG